jgi:hypothetical protein
MNLSGLRSLRSEIKRLEKQLADIAPDPEGPPPAFWDWLGHGGRYGTPAVDAECRAWWLANLPPGFVPYRLRTVNPIEERIQAILNGRLANERPPLPIGIKELPNGGSSWTSNG